MKLFEFIEALNSDDQTEVKQGLRDFLTFLRADADIVNENEGQQQNGKPKFEKSTPSIGHKRKRSFDNNNDDGKPGQALVNEYVASSPQCTELFRIWDDFILGKLGENASSLVAVLLDVLSKILLKCDSELYSSTVRYITKTVLQYKMKAIYNSFSSNEDMQLVKGSLRMLTAIITKGKRNTVREFFQKFNVSTPSFVNVLVKVERKKSRTSVRNLYIDFVLVLLEKGDISVLKRLLDSRGILKPLLQGISKDNAYRVQRLLRGITKYILSTRGITKRTKFYFFSNNMVLLGGLLSCYNVENDHLRKTVHGFMRNILIVPELNVIPSKFVDIKSNTSKKLHSDKVENIDTNVRRSLLKVADALKPAEDSLQLELLLSILGRHPELLQQYFREGINSLTIEPRPSFKWIRNVVAVVDLLQQEVVGLNNFAQVCRNLPLKNLSGNSEVSNSEKVVRNFDSECENIVLVNLPSSNLLSRAILSRGLQHSNKLVCLHSLDLLINILNRLNRVILEAGRILNETIPLDVQRSKSNMFSKANLCHRISAHIISIIPDLNVVTALRSKWKADAWVECRIMRLVYWYMKVVPTVIIGKLDIGKLITQINLQETENEVKEAKLVMAGCLTKCAALGSSYGIRWLHRLKLNESDSSGPEHSVSPLLSLLLIHVFAFKAGHRKLMSLTTNVATNALVKLQLWKSDEYITSDMLYEIDDEDVELKSHGRQSKNSGQIVNFLPIWVEAIEHDSHAKFLENLLYEYHQNGANDHITPVDFLSHAIKRAGNQEERSFVLRVALHSLHESQTTHLKLTLFDGIKRILLSEEFQQPLGSAFVYTVAQCHGFQLEGSDKVESRVLTKFWSSIQSDSFQFETAFYDALDYENDNLIFKSSVSTDFRSLIFLSRNSVPKLRRRALLVSSVLGTALSKTVSKKNSRIPPLAHVKICLEILQDIMLLEPSLDMLEICLHHEYFQSVSFFRSHTNFGTAQYSKDEEETLEFVPVALAALIQSYVSDQNTVGNGSRTSDIVDGNGLSISNTVVATVFENAVHTFLQSKETADLEACSNILFTMRSCFIYEKNNSTVLAYLAKLGPKSGMLRALLIYLLDSHTSSDAENNLKNMFQLAKSVPGEDIFSVLERCVSNHATGVIRNGGLVKFLAKIHREGNLNLVSWLWQQRKGDSDYFLVRMRITFNLIRCSNAVTNSFFQKFNDILPMSKLTDTDEIMHFTLGITACLSRSPDLLSNIAEPTDILILVFQTLQNSTLGESQRNGLIQFTQTAITNRLFPTESISSFEGKLNDMLNSMLKTQEEAEYMTYSQFQFVISLIGYKESVSTQTFSSSGSEPNIKLMKTFVTVCCETFVSVGSIVCSEGNKYRVSLLNFVNEINGQGNFLVSITEEECRKLLSKAMTCLSDRKNCLDPLNLTFIRLLLNISLKEFAQRRAKTILDLLVSHPSFVDLMSPGENVSSVYPKTLKLELIRLLHLVTALHPKKCCSASLLPLILASYNASLSLTDQELLKTIRVYSDFDQKRFSESSFCYTYGKLVNPDILDEKIMVPKKAKTSGKTEDIRTEVCILIREKYDRILESLDSERLYNTVKQFPHFRTLSNEKSSMKSSKISIQSTEDEKEKRKYDPLYLVPMLNHVFSIYALVAIDQSTPLTEQEESNNLHDSRENQEEATEMSEDLQNSFVNDQGASTPVFPAREIAANGTLGILIRSLSSSCENIRASAYSALRRYGQLAIRNKFFRERTQLVLLLRSLRYSIEEPNQRLSGIITSFLSHSVSVLLRPAHTMYTELNSFLLKRPWLDITDVPMFYTTFNSGSTEYYFERSWMLRVLADGIIDQEDLNLLSRRHVLSVTMSLFQSSLSDMNTKQLCCRLLTRVAQCDSKQEEKDETSKTTFSNGAQLLNSLGGITWTMGAISRLIDDSETLSGVKASSDFKYSNYDGEKVETENEETGESNLVSSLCNLLKILLGKSNKANLQSQFLYGVELPILSERLAKAILKFNKNAQSPSVLSALVETLYTLSGKNLSVDNPQNNVVVKASVPESGLGLTSLKVETVYLLLTQLVAHREALTQHMNSSQILALLFSNRYTLLSSCSENQDNEWEVLLDFMVDVSLSQSDNKHQKDFDSSNALRDWAFRYKSLIARILRKNRSLNDAFLTLMGRS